MSEDEVTRIEASEKARDLEGKDSLSDAALPSAERWKLRKYELMEELTSKLRTTLTLTITVLGVFIALLSGLGYLGMTAYIQSVFREKIEQETKRFDKLREDINKREKNLYADQKLFLAVLGKYSKEVQIMSELISSATNEVNKSETLNLTDMAEFKKSLLNYIQKISDFKMLPGESKKLESKLYQNSTLHSNDFTALSELFLIYQHLWSLDYVLTKLIEDLVKEEATDREAKSILLGEYEAKVYPIYQEGRNKIGDAQWGITGPGWQTLGPSADTLFFSLSPYYHSPTRGP